MRRVLIVIAVAPLVLLLVAAGFLGEAHLEIRSLWPKLPDREALAELGAAGDGPVRLSYLNTASQSGPGSPPVGHPSFLLEWTDGRIFAIDTGMTPDGARAFGEPMELLLGSDPIEVFGSIGEQMGPAAARIGGVAFTHLHQDHTDGLASLCDGRDGELAVFQTTRQAERGNYTTAPGAAHLDAAACIRRERLTSGPLHEVPGFPGLAAIEGSGHTPGSTIFAARVGDTLWLFAGDVSNFQQNLLDDVAKPAVYSLLVTPESRGALAHLRRWLGERDAEPGVRVVVSHDVEAIAARGIPAWRP